MDDNKLHNTMDNLSQLLGYSGPRDTGNNDIEAAWYVGATGYNDDGIYTDFSEQYIAEGRWENRCEDKYTEIVKNMKVGDRIVIKSSYTKKKGLPFNNHGRVFGVMAIKAIGVITKNYDDGKNIAVEWKKVEPIKEWFGDGTLRTTVHYVSAADSYIKKALLMFTFADVPQDFSIYEENEDDVNSGVDNTVKLENTEKVFINLNFTTNIKCDYDRNRIFFGAPGTGKSHELNKQTKLFAGDYYERVTFHPEYTHSGFFGTYKPVSNPNDPNKITYKFVAGPFLRVLSKALINANIEVNHHPFVLIIEEINRANMAAVFGEVFQLLDRESDTNSEFINASKYPISPSEDVKKYLAEEFNKAGVNVTKEVFKELRIPDNMFIWASMNSADQGVFPMDTAFKRRWEFEYFNIDDNEEVISSYTFNIGGKDINWNSLRKAINQRLISLRINEDKLLGPFFIGESVLREGNNEKIIKAIKNKVIMYLFEDAARQKRKDVFVNGYEKTYSQICKDFDSKGLGIFTTENID